MANVSPQKSTLFSRNADSRLSSEVGRPVPVSCGSRQTSRLSAPVSASAIAPRNHGPIADWVNEWTLATTPERVRNVPTSVNAKVAITSETVHAFSDPASLATIEEWTKAVAVSQGRSAAFSTGSQAQ